MTNDRQFNVGILADDLTSAADGAGPFVERGLDAVVGRGRLPEARATTLAIDSGSRSTSAAKARELVTEFTAQLASCDVLYKTCDSTLRGHLKVELEAAFAASGRETLVFAPAFPSAGRTTVNGVQFVDQIPVAESIYSRDPVHPVRQSRLAECVPVSGKVVILNAVTQAELDAKVAALPHPETIFWVGSPGMAIALAKRLTSSDAAPRVAVAPSGEILVAIGTANPLSHRQADRLVGRDKVTLLRAPIARANDPASILRDIADDAVARLRGAQFGTVIATGGDTMEAILDGLNVHTFELLRELEPGFPLGRAGLSSGSDLLIAMKAGGFGDDDTLHHAVDQLRHSVPDKGTARP